MARNLRTSLISGGFGRVPGGRAAITPFGSAPIPSAPTAPTINPAPPLPRIIPPTPPVFTNMATAPVVATGLQLPSNPQPFQFGNPFNDFTNATSTGDAADAAAAEAESEDSGEGDGDE